MDTTPAIASLVASTADLYRAVKTLKPYIRRKKPGDANFVYDTGVLVIQAGPISARLRAEGAWDGTVTCSGLVILALYEGILGGEEVTIAFERVGRLRVGGASFPARWDSVRTPPVTLPFNATLNDVLGLRLKYTEAELTRAGLVGDLVTAERKRDHAITQAAKALDGLDISRADLIELHTERLREHYGSADASTD